MKENIPEKDLKHFDSTFRIIPETNHPLKILMGLQREKAPVPERFFLAALSAFPSLGHTDRDCKHHRYCHQSG